MRIEQALKADRSKTVRVRGFLLVCGDEPPRLCSELLESLPPQCGGASLVVEGLDMDTVSGIDRSGDCAWSSDPVELEGRVEDGILHIA